MVHQMNSTSNNASLEYKMCAGRGCDRVGTTTLKVRHINKTGIFCDYCANDLLTEDLAVKVEDD